jgi:hypothetical protein
LFGAAVAFAATVFLAALAGACAAAGASDPIAVATAKIPIEVENR